MQYNLKIYLLWLTALFFILFLGHSSFPHTQNASLDFLENFTNWDGKYYLSIAKFGYIEDSHYAFFPLYPLTINLLSKFTGDFNLSAILISLIATFLAINVFYKLIRIDFDKQIAEKGVYALLVFPTSFYLLMGYSEGLFLFLSLSTVYFFRKGNFFMATIFGLLSSVTRIFGLVLIMSIFLQIFVNGRFTKKNWMILLSPLGFVAYCIYLYINKGDPFYFMSVQSEWSRQLSLPWAGFWVAIYGIFQPDFLVKYYYVLLNLIFGIFGLGLAIRSFRFLPPVYSFYAFFSVLLPLLTSNLSSMPRFLLPIFPIFILIGLIKKEFIYTLFCTISLLLLSVLAVLFFNGYWVS